VQRKPAVEPLPWPEPSGEEEAAHSGEAPLRRAALASGPVLSPAVAPEGSAAGLQDEVLARAAARARLPLTHSLQMSAARAQPLPVEVPEAPRSQPAEPETVLRQVHPARRAPEPAGELPLLPVAPVLAAPLVQRKAITPAAQVVTAVPRPVDTLQRAQAEDEPEPAAPAEPAPPDLEQLARQVYPMIRRMLKVERERAFGR
jgi:hypothetical protein